MPLNFNNPYSGSALALPKFTVHYRSNVRVLSLPEYRILCIDHYWNTTDFAIIPALEAMETLTKYCTYPQLRLLLVGKISLLGDLRFPSYRPKKTLVYNRVPRNIPVINIPVIRCVPSGYGAEQLYRPHRHIPLTEHFWQQLSHLGDKNSGRLP